MGHRKKTAFTEQQHEVLVGVSRCCLCQGRGRSWVCLPCRTSPHLRSPLPSGLPPHASRLRCRCCRVLTMKELSSPALMEFSPLSPTSELSPLLLLLLRLRLRMMLRLIPRPTRGTRTMLLTPTPMLDMEDTTTPLTPTATLPTPTPVSTPTTVCLIIMDTMARERLPLSLPLIPRLIPRLTPGIPTMVL